MDTPTIQDVARAANVSTATVSRALSSPDRVSEPTRRRVYEAVERTGYAVNQTARNLRRRRTGAIVVLVPNLGNPFFSRILAGIETAASLAGYTVLICDSRQQRGGEERLAEYVRNNRADGLISLDGGLPPHLLEGDNGRRPVSIFACEWSEASELPSVRFDNAGGAELAVDHLAALGHTAIGHVLGPLENVLTKARFDGYARGLAAHGLARRGDWIFGGDFSLDAGAEAAKRWLALADRPTAVFCSSDEMACGFISELNRRDHSVPDEVSVVGFDDIDIAARFIPALTTVRQPRHEIGEAAFAALLDRIEAKDSAPGLTMLPARLIVRESTKAA